MLTIGPSTWFKERLDEDFPGFKIWMPDADKEITAYQFAAYQGFLQYNLVPFLISRCVCHISENCRDEVKPKCSMNEEQRNMVVTWAESRTEAVYKERLDTIANEYQLWVTWLESRRDEFVAWRFLQHRYKRYGKTTSNCAELVNNSRTFIVNT